MTDTKSQEELEFYSASVNAWYSTALEHDKSLLTLSAGGIGLLITLLTMDEIKSCLTLVLYSIAMVCFVICLISVLKIFNGNREHIIKLFQGDDNLHDPKLERLDKIAFWSFIFGVVFSVIVGITTAYQQFSKKEPNMTDNKSKTTRGIAQDSFSGVQNLQKSFTGVQQLKPAATPNSTTQASQPAPTQQPVTPVKKD
ncbi:MAG: hypothetical protein WC009_08750 [Methylotenera sp.]